MLRKKLSLLITAFISITHLLSAQCQPKSTDSSTESYSQQLTTSQQAAYEEYYKAQEHWIPSVDIDISAGYNSNVNEGPTVRPLNIWLSAPIEQGQFGLSLDTKTYRYYNAWLVKLGLNGSMTGYLERTELNYGDISLWASGDRTINDEWTAGTKITASRYVQPNDPSISLRLSSTNFTYWSFTLNPNVQYYFSEWGSLQLSYSHNIEDYQKIEDSTPYDNNNNTFSLTLNTQFNQFNGSISGTYYNINYKDLTAYTPEGNNNDQGIIDNYHNWTAGVDLSYTFESWYPWLNYTYTYQKGNFEGYDNYQSNSVSLGFSYSFGTQQQYTIDGYVSYDNYNYDAMLVTPDTFLNYFSNIYSGETVKFKDFTSFLEFSWQAQSRLKIYANSNFYNRDSNEKSRFTMYNHGYQQWISTVGMHMTF